MEFDLCVPDPFDPNFLELDNLPVHQIFSDNNLSNWALVDDLDYHWAIKYLWNLKTDSRKLSYMRRAVRTPSGIITQYLHIEIMKRTEIVPPSTSHNVVDHRNGNTLDCRRKNLRWVTHSMNAKNVRGVMQHDFVEG